MIPPNHRKSKPAESQGGRETQASWRLCLISRLSCPSQWKGLLPNLESDPTSSAKSAEQVPSDAAGSQALAALARCCSEDSNRHPKGLSKSTVPLHPILAQLLKDWRAETAYAGDNDYVFASRKTSGRTPRYGSVVVEDYLRPAAVRAGVLEIKDGETFIDGELVKRFGFHTFRHSLTSWLMANGEDPQIVRAMLRWTTLNMLAHYTHGFKADKLEAQGAVLKKLVRPGNPSDREPERELKEVKSS